jgi:arylsulfatase A-like enzyme
MGLMQEKNTSDWRKEVLTTYNGNQFGLCTQRMIRDKTWKYIWNLTDVDELYKLDDDPNELNNLVYDKRYKQILKEKRLRLYQILVEEEDGIINYWTQKQLLEQKKL